MFRTSAFKRLLHALGDASSCTFAYCRLGAEHQKYTTLFYTRDAARVLDPLNNPDYQCNHPKGHHEGQLAGRLEDGTWASKHAAAYPRELCVRLAMAANYARTGCMFALFGATKAAGEDEAAAGAEPLGPGADRPPERPPDVEAAGDFVGHSRALQSRRLRMLLCGSFLATFLPAPARIVVALATGTIAAIAGSAALFQHLMLRWLPSLVSSRRTVYVINCCLSAQLVLASCWTGYVALCDGIQPLELGASDLAGMARHTFHGDAWPPFMTRPVIFRAAASSLVASGQWPSWYEFQPRRWARQLGDPLVSINGLPGSGTRFHYVDLERDAIVRPAPTLFKLQDVLDSWAREALGGGGDETLYLSTYRGDETTPGSFQASVQARLLAQLSRILGFNRIPDALPLPTDSLGRWWLNMGAHRGGQSVHSDFDDNVYVHLGGRKRFQLFHPLASIGLRPLPELVATRHSPGNYTFRRTQSHGEPCNHNYPQAPYGMAAEDTHGVEVILERGDILLIPGMWWHGVQRLPPEATESEPVHGPDEFNMGMSIFYNLEWTHLYRDIWFVLNKAGVRGLMCAAVAQAASRVHPLQLAAFFRNRWRFDESSGRCLRCDHPGAPAAKDDAHTTTASRWMRMCIGSSGP